MIYINGHDLTIEQVIAVSREGETVAIAPEAVERINAARAYVDRKLAEKAVVYGLTTGFGKFSTVFVPEEETAELQRNLIISHACGMGRPLPARVRCAPRTSARDSPPTALPICVVRPMS